jgi:hypothetical protein
LLEDLEHDLIDEVVLAREVVADEAFTDPNALADAGQGGPSEANFGDGVWPGAAGDGR